MTAMEQPPPSRATIKEYLDAEEKSVERHEYHDGYIHQMQGGTFNHSRISANLIAGIHTALRGTPCFVLESNMKLRVERANKYCYPDAMIVCGQPLFDTHDTRQTTILNPRVIVEVLSDSTEAYDRGEKFRDYMLVDSLEEYVLVSTNVARVESLLRQPDGTWSFQHAVERESAFEMRSLKISLKLVDLYEGITFPPPKPQPGTEPITT
jgi:Uma2 family endonuclease